MKKCSELIGLPIVKENGQLTSYLIKSIIYAKRGLKIIGFCLYTQTKRVRREKHIKVLPYNKIKELKDEGIVVASEKDIVRGDQIHAIEEALEEKQEIMGFEVYSMNEELIGVIKDGIFDTKTGKLIGLVLSEGIFSDLATGYSVLPLNNCVDLGSEHIKLNEEQINSITSQEGGLKKLLGIDQRN